MVTAELAVALPVLVVVLAGCLFAESAVAEQLRCVDAARAAARALARGDAAPSAVALARRAGPPGAVVTLERGAAEVRVSVRAEVAAPGPLHDLVPGLPVSAVAAAALEPGAP